MNGDELLLKSSGSDERQIKGGNYLLELIGDLGQVRSEI